MYQFIKRLAMPLTCASLLGAACHAKTARAQPTSTTVDEWRLIGGNEYEQHFSALSAINENNVRGLKLKWYADMPTKDGLTGIPIVVGGVVYQSGGLGKAWANDLRTGKLLWSFDAGMHFPMGVLTSWGARISRGLAVWQDKVLKATGDCRLFALDRRTGRKIWEVQTCDPVEPKAISGAPRVGDGKVFIGNSNGDSGIGRGYVDAYDVQTGRHLWRFYTIPGDPSKGFENKAMEMASKTWGKDYWKKTGGGTAWEGITYDPRTRLVYIGTDGAAPWNPLARGEGLGDELFTNAIVAVRADSGEYVWHYSTTPMDGWDYNATSPVVLADLSIGGKRRAAVMSAPKNGFFYLLDAYTGTLLNQPKNIVPVTWASHIDMATGRPVVLPDAQYWKKGDRGVVYAPATIGAHNWQPMSYSPLTGLVYIPAIDAPAQIALDPHHFGGANDDVYYSLEHKGTFKGTLIAWDPLKQETRWRHDVGKPYQGGTLATAGNLVFQGRGEGQFTAYRADSGELLWSYEVGSSMVGAPSTVEVDGEQIILIAAGSGTTSSGLIVIPQISALPGGPARLLAFSLNGQATLPQSSKQVQPFNRPTAPEPSAALVLKGKQIWEENFCEACHGFKAIGGGAGSVPDLRRVVPMPLNVFSGFVRGGLLKDNGMPVFANAIREHELPALHAYILQQAWKAYYAETSAP
jgi:PQQ-dependent dehydrogenase (methanol/ethanol family)